MQLTQPRERQARTVTRGSLAVEVRHGFVATRALEQDGRRLTAVVELEEELLVPQVGID